jgi:rhodanese-related sulfurtransferase
MDTANSPTAANTAISVSALRSTLGTPFAPCLVDVRRAAAFASDPFMLPAAMRGAPEDLSAWADTLSPDRPIVVYCVHGHEVSQRAAAELRERGREASYLEGGIEAWKDAGAPAMRKRPEIRLPGSKTSQWVTRERPKIDRIACPWLIRRFIDPRAEFLYVPAGEVLDTAVRLNALPYDVPDVQFSHVGDHCSFDAVLKFFEIDEPSLNRLATIVRGADTGKPELTPQSPGLLAISLGLSANFPNDLDLLEHGMHVYDALYAWLRLAHGEAHNADLIRKSVAR